MEWKQWKIKKRPIICTHDAYHGACHDMAATCAPKSQENQRATFLHPWRSPWGHGIRHGPKTHVLHNLHSWRLPWGRDVQHGLWGLKNSTLKTQFVPLLHTFLLLIEHDFQAFSTSFSSINKLIFQLFILEIFLE